jgi:hypothetical protein
MSDVAVPAWQMCRRRLLLWEELTWSSSARQAASQAVCMVTVEASYFLMKIEGAWEQGAEETIRT